MQFEGATDITASLRAGVYILVHLGHVVYVGKSKCMLSRINQHRALYGQKSKKQNIPGWLPTKAILYNEMHVIPCRLDNIDYIERKLIEKYQPRHNVQHKPRIKVPIELNINGVVLALTANKPKSEFIRRC